MTSHFSRRRTLGLLSAAAAGAFSLGLPGFAAAQAKRQLRVGFQKYGTLIILKARGTLEQRLAPLGVEVKWTEFPAGPQMLEALNVGGLDFGIVGEAPPIFAQAAGADLVYVANEPAAPGGEAVIVPASSRATRVADLKGKRIALNKGSNVHYLLLKALEQAGVQYSDIEPVYLPPSDARAAFERGAVDAWVIWDPFFAAAQTQLNARILVDGRGLASNHQFYVAARGYARQNADVLRAFVDELAKVDQWSAQHIPDVASQLSPLIGLPPATVELAGRRFAYGVKLVDDSVIAEQQKIADAFAALKLIPKPIRVRDALLT
ncbi:MAG: sulfonate ABC transporter substrate-binding protein [Burkholderiaceae bacterium]|nr:sulfonate ABC transporter substrate-binding protein [Burkholderiaceae bacterium]